MKPSAFEKLVAKFAENVVAQGEAIWRGDAKTGNGHARRYIAAWMKLVSAGDAGRDAMVPLLAHPHPEVRSMAAAFLLRYRHREARAVLEEVARGRGLAAFGAGECLKRWEEGAWALDLVEDVPAPPPANAPKPAARPRRRPSPRMRARREE